MIQVIGITIPILYFGFNRVGLYNWAAGGMNFMELHGLANLRFDYRHNKFHWNNFINLQLGVIKSGYGNQGIWLKNDDLIELRSKFSRRTKHLWDYSFNRYKISIYIWILY